MTTTRRGPYARKVTSSFRFGDYRLYCNDDGKGYDFIGTARRADEWVGGTADRRQRRTIRVCLPPGVDGANTSKYPGGADFSRFARDAVTWTVGARVLGVGLKTKSGFSENVGMTFKFGGSPGKKHLLCGSKGKPVTTAGRIFSGLNPAFASDH